MWRTPELTSHSRYSSLPCLLLSYKHTHTHTIRPSVHPSICYMHCACHMWKEWWYRPRIYAACGLSLHVVFFRVLKTLTMEGLPAELALRLLRQHVFLGAWLLKQPCSLTAHHNTTWMDTAKSFLSVHCLLLSTSSSHPCVSSSPAQLQCWGTPQSCGWLAARDACSAHTYISPRIAHIFSGLSEQGHSSDISAYQLLGCHCLGRRLLSIREMWPRKLSLSWESIEDSLCCLAILRIVV